MKKALFVINGYQNNPNNAYKIKRLKEEFHPYGVECEVRDALALLPFCRGDEIELDLKDYSFALDFDKDMYLAKVLSMKLPLFNSYESMMLSDDKMLSILSLQNKGVAVPETIPAPLCYTANPEREKRMLFLDVLERRLGYPLVFKECHGSLGRQVLLVRSREELEEIEEKYCFTQHLYEKFLSVHQGHDYRIIVIDQKVIACMERKNSHDFRSNIALGGTGRDVTDTLDEAYKQLALQASKTLGLLYAGIDVGISDEGKPVFIEANGNAFFTEIEAVSKINIAKELALAILKRIG